MAVLVNIPAIILTHGIVPNEEMIRKADEEAITILSTSKSSFEMSRALAQILY